MALVGLIRALCRRPQDFHNAEVRRSLNADESMGAAIVEPGMKL